MGELKTSSVVIELRYEFESMMFTQEFAGNKRKQNGSIVLSFHLFRTLILQDLNCVNIVTVLAPA